MNNDKLIMQLIGAARAVDSVIIDHDHPAYTNVQIASNSIHQAMKQAAGSKHMKFWRVKSVSSGSFFGRFKSEASAKVAAEDANSEFKNGLNDYTAECKVARPEPVQLPLTVKPNGRNSFAIFDATGDMIASSFSTKEAADEYAKLQAQHPNDALFRGPGGRLSRSVGNDDSTKADVDETDVEKVQISEFDYSIKVVTRRVAQLVENAMRELKQAEVPGGSEALFNKVVNAREYLEMAAKELR